MLEQNKKKEENFKQNIKVLLNALAYTATFFSIIYAIILTLSISYNVGYFKQINPQIIDLMEIGDYIDDATHHLWFFLLASLLFFSSSLAILVKNRDKKLYKIFAFGIFSLVLSSYFFLEGIYYSRFWLALKKLTLNESTLIYLCLIAFLILFLSFLCYKVAYNLIRAELSYSSLSKGSIIIFLIMVLMPYLGGMARGYVEAKVMHPQDFSNFKVSVVIVNDSILEDVIILKKLSKGLLIKRLNSDNNLNQQAVSLVNWGAIKYIIYSKAS